MESETQVIAIDVCGELLKYDRMGEIFSASAGITLSRQLTTSSFTLKSLELVERVRFLISSPAASFSTVSQLPLVYLYSNEESSANSRTRCHEFGFTLVIASSPGSQPFNVPTIYTVSSSGVNSGTLTLKVTITVSDNAGLKLIKAKTNNSNCHFLKKR